MNTLLLQDILGEPEWTNLLAPADRRGLTPLFWTHVRPYGEVNLGMDARLNLTPGTVPGPLPRLLSSQNQRQGRRVSDGVTWRRHRCGACPSSGLISQREGRGCCRRQ
ncbi:hypothetical protein [Streptomyces sp. NPDC046161]|uniref:hypothetical protein n=1 Tax=Streptomyces sp. NPDC046161 TaxID=3155132 RepID=UPI0033D1FE4D